MSERLVSFAASLDGVDGGVDDREAAVAVLEARAESALGDLQSAAASLAADGGRDAVRTLYELSWIAPGALLSSLEALAAALERPGERPYAAGALANVTEGADFRDWDGHAERLTERARADDPTVRRRALTAVARVARVNPKRVGDAQAAVWAALDADDEGVRDAALSALYHLLTVYELSDAASPTTLATLAESDDAERRALATGALVNALYWTCDDEVAGIVFRVADRALEDEDPRVRRFATELFRAEGPGRWTDYFGSDPGEDVESFVLTVLEAREDPDDTVARRVERAVADVARYYPFPLSSLAETRPDVVRSVSPELRSALDQYSDENERAAWEALAAIDAVPDDYDGPPDPGCDDWTDSDGTGDDGATDADESEPAASESEGAQDGGREVEPEWPAEAQRGTGDADRDEAQRSLDDFSDE